MGEIVTAGMGPGLGIDLTEIFMPNYNWFQTFTSMNIVIDSCFASVSVAII